MTSSEEKAARKARAAEYAASLNTQIQSNKEHKLEADQNEQSLGGGAPAPTGNVAKDQKTRENDDKRAKQMAYRQMLDQQRNNKVQKENDEVVPTNLKDRPF